MTEKHTYGHSTDIYNEPNNYIHETKKKKKLWMPKENVVLFDLLSAEAPRGRTEEILLLGSGNPPPPPPKVEGGGEL